MIKRTQMIGLILLAGWVVAGCVRSPQAKEAKFLESGKKQLEKKDYTRAILEFKNAVQVMPKDAEPHYQLGMAYLRAGDPNSAAMCFQQAVKLDPKHPGAQLRLAEMMAASPSREMQEEAARRSEEVLSLSPDNIDALNALAFAELRLGNPDDAEKHLQKALEKAPDSLQSSIALARVKLSRKDVAGAEQVLQQAVAQAPKSAPGLVTLGEFYGALNRNQEAEQQFRTVLQMDPKNGPALFDLATMQARAGQNEQAEQTFRLLAELPEKQYKPLHALFQFRIGKHEEAVAEFEKLAKANPADRETRGNLVKVYLSMNRVPDAERVLNDALKRNSRDAEALLDRSKIYLSTGKDAEAQADLKQAVRLQPYSAEAHYLLSKVHQTRGDAENRQQELRETLRLNPLYLPARLELARILIASNAAQAALTALDEAPAEQKTTTGFVVERNWALLALGERAEVRKNLDQILTRDRIPDAVVQDALLKLGQKDFAGARTSLEEVLGKNPEDIRALGLLVQTYAAQKQPATGIQKAREYAARTPKSARLQEFLGQLLTANGRSEEARKAFEAAKAANPGAVTADLSLADLDIKEGKLDSARRNLSAILAANNNNLTARQLLAGLEVTAGNQAAAIEHYRKALEQNPRDIIALNNLAYLLSEQANQLDEALSYAQQAKQLAPEDPAIADTLGWIYYRKGLYRNAVQQLEAAVEKGETARRRYHLAMAYVKAGDYTRGRQTFDTARKMDAKLPEAQTAQQLLAEPATERR